MKIESGMNLNDLQERMGSEATEDEAFQMRELLINGEYDSQDTADIPESTWLSMLDQAATAAAQTTRIVDKDVFLSNKDALIYKPEYEDKAYSAKDLIDLCRKNLVGNAEDNAWELYNLCEWQSPYTILQEDADTPSADRFFKHKSDSPRPPRRSNGPSL